MSEDKRLSAKAYEVMDGNEYPPVIGPDENVPEFTLKAVIIGCLIGAVFGAANAYLGLKVGLTVSASIPAAVMAVALFKLFRSGTLLETNIVQTIGSAGESLAAGVIFTIPAFFLWNIEPGKMEIVLISILGGMLGGLFMIPLRRFLIVKEHGKLPYPEGTACAEVQVVGQGDVTKARALFAGMGLGGLYQFFMHGESFALWTKEPFYQFQKFKGALLGAEITPELLGVGYIIGPRIAAIMLGGGLLGWFVLIPLITLFGANVGVPVYPETVSALSEMGPWGIWSRYVRYIGAGGVAFAGIFALIKSLPVIVQSFSAGLKGMGSAGAASTIRTQEDLPMRWILPASLFLSVLIAVYLCSSFFTGQYLVYGLVAAFLIVLFSFFFVTVSSRIVGLLGSSSNPVSGMTIATLVITSLIFLFFGL
ncbi:oligopeptide transporter, OPT family, partial [bacterium]|nr:oligopeptide transporter, OPT family [bacterium]